MSKQEYGRIELEEASKEEERALFIAIRGGDEQAMERLLQSEMARAYEAADRCESSAASFSELFPEARAALIEAIHDFDPDTDERFTPFLMRRLEARMQNFYAHLPWLLPIDYRVVQLHDAFEAALLALYPNSPDRADAAVHDDGFVADYLGVTEEQLRAVKHEYEICRIEALDESIKIDPSLPDDYEDEDIDNKSPRIEFVADPATENAAADYLETLMGCLSDAERYIVCARDGVLSAKARTDEQIAATLGVAPHRVEALYRAAIEKLRKAGA